MRRTKFLFAALILFLLLLGTTTILVLGNEYKIGVKQGDNLAWKCNIVDEEKLQKLFGIGWQEKFLLLKGIREGAIMQWEILETSENDLVYSMRTGSNERALKIVFNYLGWTESERTQGTPLEMRLYYFINPNHFPENFIFLDYVPFWLPIPVGEYLKELETTLHKGYEVDVTYLLTLSLEVKQGDEQGGNPSEDFKVMALYDSQGILVSYKLYIGNHQVLIDISLISKFIYQFPVFLILVLAFSLVTIYFYKRY